MESVTVEDLDTLVQQIFHERHKIDKMEDAVKEEKKKLNLLEQSAIHHLEQLNRESYKTDFGTIRISNIYRYRLPETPEAKQAFFGYLKNQGVFESMATVHSATYNSYCQAELAAAQQRGEFLALPGVPEPDVFKKLSVRKG